MALIIKSGDLVKDKSIDIFCHQCNCFATMGAGIARQISAEYPEVSKADRQAFEKYGPESLFGKVLSVACHDGRYCQNMYSQYHYGTRKQMTDYKKFEECLEHVRVFAEKHPNKTIGFPYGIGCGLAGGDWKTVEGLITRFSESVGNDVYIVRFER